MERPTNAPSSCHAYRMTGLLLLVATTALPACGRSDSQTPAPIATEAPITAPSPDADEDAAAHPTRAWVTGTVIYRQRIALGPEAVVTVRLVDVSRADAPGEVLAESVIPTEGRQVPIPFELAYDAARIDPRLQYAIQARITAGDQLLFTTTEAFRVITNGNPASIAVRVDPAG